MKLITKNKKVSILLVMMLLVTAIGWVALSERTQAAPSLGETLLVGDANADSKFNVQDLVRIKRYVKDTSLACTLDGDLNVDGSIGENDDVRCREMLVTGNHSLQVAVKESDIAKQVDDADGYYTYYDLKKGLKAGQTLTFKIDGLPSGVTSYDVYAYYTGSDQWVKLAKNASASGAVTNTNTYRLVPNVDVTQVRIYVVNKSTNATVAFRIYDIQVYASSAGGAVTDMRVLYQQSTDIPVVFGANDTLDLTKFSVDTASQDLTYKWSIKKDGGSSSDLTMTNTAYKVTGGTGTYTITATVNKTGYSGSASQKIYVLAPQVYVGYDNGAVKNTGTSTGATASLKGLTEDGTACTSTAFENYSGTVTYVPGIDGDAKGALQVNRQAGAVTVVNGYTLPSEFTISTWFNKDADTNANITTGSGEFLFGNANPDGTSGFSVVLKKRDAASDIHQIRIKFGSNSANWVDVDFNRYGWNNIAITCDGSVLTVYMNGEEAGEVALPSGFSFGSAPVAFGAYPVESGKTFTYVDRAIYYDDIQMYNSVLDADTISLIAASDKKGADVIVDFNDGVIKNTGYSNATAKALYAAKNASSFAEYSGDVTFVDGFQTESNGAIKSNHPNGPHPVVQGYNFGTEDFTISTWFNVPTAGSLSTGNGSYLIGTSKADDTSDGFRITLRRNSGDTKFEFQFRAAGNTTGLKEFKGFTYGEWHNLVIVREGGNLTLYADGTLIHTETFSETFDFGSKALALGAYIGETWTYNGKDIYYDDLRIYDSALCKGEAVEFYESKVADPVVSLSYTAGSMDNAGSNDRARIGAYRLSEISSTTNHFVSTDVLPFSKGADGETHAGFATTHKDGSYTLIRDHVFGKNDFTINTWFNITDATELDTSASYYLLGTRNPNGGLGFSLCLKKSEIRFRIGSTNNTVKFDEAIENWESNKWYHLSLRRDGEEMTLWLNGIKVHTVSGVTNNFGTDDLSFGGYLGFANNYKDTVTIYDEIRIYDVALSDELIAQAGDGTLDDITVEATDRSSETTNTGLLYVNAGQRKAWDPGVIYIEEGPYAGTFCMYVAHENEIKVSTSKDLVNWSSAVACYSPLEDATWMDGSVWAPEIIYEDGYYYLFYSAAMIDSATDIWRSGYKYLGVARSTDPTQGFTKISDTPLFGGKTIAGAQASGETDRAYIYQGFIDANPFVDPKTGNKYLYMTRNRDNSDTNVIAVVQMETWSKPIYSTYKELTTPGVTTVGGSTATVLAEGDVNEGSQVLYRDEKYYLTFSVNQAHEANYAVVQAVGDSPMGPFTKLQPSEGGLLLGANLPSDLTSNKVSGSGHHCFVEVEDELYIVYHQHDDPTTPSLDRIYSMDRVYWTTNSKGQNILKANGPTRSMQPMPSFVSGYSNLATGAQITASNSNDSVKYLNDKFIKYNSTDVAGQYEVSGLASGATVTMTMKFDNFVKARALLLYNSYKYDNAFGSVKNVTLTYREVVDNVSRTGKMTLNSAASSSVFNYDFGTWSYDSATGKYLSTGAPMVLEFEEKEINEVTIEFVPRSGVTSLAISEMMLLGKETLNADVHVNYTGGKFNYATSDVDATVGAYAPNASGKFTAFVSTNDVTYTTGIEGDAYGAISTQHTTGAYTVVDKYNFGTKDFTISTWFNIPTTTQDASSGAGTYLFGNAQPDAGSSEKGFSICLKPAEVRFRVNGTNQSAEAISYAKGTWNNVTLKREGTSLKLYFNGELVSTATIAADCDFGTKDLAFGGYYNNSNNYNANLMFFDEIQVYNKALSISKIEELANQF